MKRLDLARKFLRDTFDLDKEFVLLKVRFIDVPDFVGGFDRYMTFYGKTEGRIEFFEVPLEKILLKIDNNLFP